MTLTWEIPVTKSYSFRCFLARRGSEEFWLRERTFGWRLLVFDHTGFVHARNYRSLRAAKQAAEEH